MTGWHPSSLSLDVILPHPFSHAVINSLKFYECQLQLLKIKDCRAKAESAAASRRPRDEHGHKDGSAIHGPRDKLRDESDRKSGVMMAEVSATPFCAQVLAGAHALPHVLDGHFAEDRSSQAAVVVVSKR